MSFYRTTLSGQKTVVPAFVFVRSWAGGFFTGFCVNMACGFFATRLSVLLVSNSMAVGGAETALVPLEIDGLLELRDAAVEGSFFFGGDGVVGGAGAAAAAAVVPSSNGGKGGFNFREEFLDFDVLARGGPSEMVERTLDDLVTVCGCSRQFFEMGVEIVGQVRALGENTGFSVDWVRVGRGDDVVDKLGGSRCYELILSPR